MFDLTPEDTWIVLIAGVLTGGTVLALIVNELAGRPRDRPVARIGLAAGLGLGVVSVSIKAVLVFVLGIQSPGSLTALSTWSSLLAPEAEAAAVAVVLPAAPEGDRPRPWRALPAVAPAPADNPTTAAKVALGERLFLDRRLSSDGTVACASCHRLEDGGDDNARVSTGIEGKKGGRNAPTVWNAAFLSRLFWDGRAASLEEQAKGPLTNPVEMGMASDDAVVAVVRAAPDYADAFRTAFPKADPPITIETIAKAIAAFERTLITPDTPYDRFVAGDRDALTAQQIRGMALFKEAGCRACHVDPTFSSAGLVAPAGVWRPFPVFAEHPRADRHGLLEDRGRLPADTELPFGVWRVPSLRNVSRTAPYFHNGSVDSLEEAVRVMAEGLLGKQLSDRQADDLAVSWSPTERRVSLTRGRALSDTEIGDITAFLGSLAPGND